MNNHFIYFFGKNMFYIKKNLIISKSFVTYLTGYWNTIIILNYAVSAIKIKIRS